MSDATHTEHSGREYGSASTNEAGGPIPIDDRHASSAFRHNSLEYGVRLATGVIGLSLILLALSNLTSPPLAAKAIALLHSPTVQWLLIAGFAVVLVVAALKSGPYDP